MATERLQKFLSAAGVSSRREAEEMILAGRVAVNGKIVKELGTKTDPDADHVKVDGKLIHPKKLRSYYLLNNPRGVVVTRDDPEGRPTVAGLLANRIPGRVVPVGRLDFESEGLLILTDDGALVQKLTHPSGGCKKEYEVKVAGIPSPAQIARLERGIVLPDETRRTAPATIELTETTPERNGVGGNSWLRVILSEGRSRQIRRMFDLVGHPVSKLRRVAIGPLRDRGLKPGQFRELTEPEVRALFALKAAPKRGTRAAPRLSKPSDPKRETEREDRGAPTGVPKSAPKGTPRFSPKRGATR